MDVFKNFASSVNTVHRLLTTSKRSNEELRRSNVQERHDWGTTKWVVLVFALVRFMLFHGVTSHDDTPHTAKEARAHTESSGDVKGNPRTNLKEVMWTCNHAEQEIATCWVRSWLVWSFQIPKSQVAAHVCLR